MFIFTAGVNLHLIALLIDFTDIAIDRLHTVHCSCYLILVPRANA